MVDKCTARKIPCASETICNPSSGRCVQKTGKIGRSLLALLGGGGGGGGGGQRPATLAEVVAHFKRIKEPVPQDESYMSWFNKYAGAVNISSKILFDIIKPGETKSFVVFDVNSEDNEEIIDDLLHPESFRIISGTRGKASDGSVKNNRDIMDILEDYYEDGHPVYNARMDEIIEWEEGVLWKGENTYPGRYEMQYTWFMNVSPKTEAPQAPGRKAPAGSAADYAGQRARGLDGKMWESRRLAKIVRQNGKPTYRWFLLK